MSIIKLNSNHNEMVKELFTHKKYMGEPVSEQFNLLLYDRFINTYTFGLNNFHSYGYIDNNKIHALISFYESDEEPAWYYTLHRSIGNKNAITQVLDKVIEHNEKNGRLKFYSLTNIKHARLSRRFNWSKYNNERYDFFDECIIPSKHKSIYTNHWELLCNRSLILTDSIVRCTFLKQKYRTILPLGGNL